MKTNIKYITILILLFDAQQAFCQVVKGNKGYETNFKGQKIFIVPTYSDNPEFHPYYYLPTNLHVSEKNGSPEFSFLAYKNDNNSDIDGGIMNFLLTWGLNSEQEEDIQRDLYKEDSTATLMGPLIVESDGFEITTNKPIAQILKNTMSSIGNVPNFAGGKLALSFRFNAEDAKAMSKAIKNPKSVDDINLVFRFRYKTMGQAEPWKIRLSLQDLFSYIINFPQCVR